MSEQRFSSHYSCPHCRRVNEKSYEYRLFAGARGIGFASTAEDACQHCRRRINRQSILNGEYDIRPSKFGWVWFIIIPVGILILMVLHG